MQLTPQQSNTLNKWLMIAGALTAILGPVVEYLTSGQLINSAGVLAALGAGIALYAKRAPGHLTGDQAEAKAHARVEEAVRQVSMPPLEMPAATGDGSGSGKIAPPFHPTALRTFDPDE